MPLDHPTADARAVRTFPGHHAVTGVLSGQELLQTHLQPIVELATGTALVAEGVEDADDLAALVRLGVGHAQGWLLARPAPVEVALPGLWRGVRPAELELP